mgnify:CR=1 FL=1
MRCFWLLEKIFYIVRLGMRVKRLGVCLYGDSRRPRRDICWLLHPLITVCSFLEAKHFERTKKLNDDLAEVLHATLNLAV